MPTQRVKIFGYIATNGYYNAAGFTNANFPKDVDWLLDGIPPEIPDASIRSFVIEANVPIPDDVPVVMEGTVVT